MKIRWLLCVLLLVTRIALAEAPAPIVVLIVDGPIGPATSDYLRRGLTQARQREAQLVVIKINTPGGLDLAMRDIVQNIIAAPVPIAVYVAPPGARAASAGTYILYAAHLAAMAPGTNLGAATPVPLGGLPELEPNDKKRDGKEGDKTPGVPAPSTAMERKLVNDAVAYLRSLAQLRSRNADWAEKAVREGASLAAQEALAQGVIDLIATDLTQLLQALDGRELNVQGTTRRLNTRQAAVETIEPDWRSRLLAVITNPNIAYLLLLLGTYGLIFELMNPSYVLPGVVGAVCLLLAFYALQVLPVNYAGLALILVGIAFMVAELFVSSFGALGIGGIVAFVAGSLMLFDTEVPAYTISLPLVATFALLSAVFFMGIIGMAVRIHRRPAVTGPEQMIGDRAEALEDFEGTGRVRAHGEAWRAICKVRVERGQPA